MAAAKSKLKLEDRLEKIKKDQGGTIKIESIAQIIEETVVESIGDQKINDHDIRRDLLLLSEYIETARSEISSLNPGDVTSKLLPAATDELDAIIEATENATNEIMAVAEELDDIGSKLDPDNAARMMDLTMRVYGACGFQDITGQRISKIVAALRKIEAKVASLVDAFGEGDGGGEKNKKANAKAAPAPDADVELPSDFDIMEGPQLPGNAIHQDEVDALLAGFD